jgi:hypothetical protein
LLIRDEEPLRDLGNSESESLQAMNALWFVSQGIPVRSAFIKKERFNLSTYRFLQQCQSPPNGRSIRAIATIKCLDPLRVEKC